jgi:hypothetical protein
MGILDKAKQLMKGRERQIEDAAEKVVDVVDNKTGGKVPDPVRDAVDKIDGTVDKSDGTVDNP